MWTACLVLVARARALSGPGRNVAPRWRSAANTAGISPWRATMRNASPSQRNSAVTGFAKARRIREDGLEHGLEVRWRITDYGKDLGGRRLALQRCAPLAGQQRDPLLVTSRGSCRNRLASRRFHGLASPRFRTAYSASCHPIPLTGEALALR